MTEIRANPEKSVRDHAILRLLYDRGLRRGEIATLDVTDFRLKEGAIDILGKGRLVKETLTLPEETLDALKRWLAIRAPLQTEPLP